MRFFIFVVLTCSLHAMSRSSPPVPKGIGVRTLVLQDLQRDRPVVVEVWYPTADKKEFDLPSDPVWVHPQEMRNVSIALGKFPLIVMSHGHGGDRRDRSWLVSALVEHGFVVASVEHFGNSWRSYDSLITLRFWERAKDVSFALNELFKDASLVKSLDPTRIGFVGYSMGGMTGLALAGAKAENVKEIISYQNAELKEVSPELIETVDFSEAQGDFKEPRIKAFALLSPAAFVYPAHAFKEIQAPIALVTSEGDEVLPFKDHSFKVMSHLKSLKLKMLHKNASHYVFLNRISDMGKSVLRKDLQTDAIETDRLKIHGEVGAFISEFFKETL